MKKKPNNKVVPAIELVLIIAGLAFASIGAIKTLSKDLPGVSMPVMAEGADTFAVDSEQPAAADPKFAGDGPRNPDGPAGAADPKTAAAEGEEPPADNGAPRSDMNMPQGAGGTLSFIIVYLVPVLIYILLFVYVLIEYRKPHGNLLRATMLIYAFMLAIWSAAQGENAGCVYILPCTAVIVAYLSGRLNKIKKNFVWIAIAAAFLIAYGILQTMMIGAISYSILQFSYCFGAVLQWITLALAYFSRYEDHIFAGKKEVPAE